MTRTTIALALALATQTLAALPVDGTYTVQPGDTLSELAAELRAQLGLEAPLWGPDGVVAALINANPEVVDASLVIRVGDQLYIPESLAVNSLRTASAQGEVPDWSGRASRPGAGTRPEEGGLFGQLSFLPSPPPAGPSVDVPRRVEGPALAPAPVEVAPVEVEPAEASLRDWLAGLADLEVPHWPSVELGETLVRQVGSGSLHGDAVDELGGLEDDADAGEAVEASPDRDDDLPFFPIGF